MQASCISRCLHCARLFSIAVLVLRAAINVAGHLPLFGWIINQSCELLGQLRPRAFWQVECRQFPVPIGQSKPNAELLVGRCVNRNGYMKGSAAVIRVKPNLPCAAKTVRRQGCRKEITQSL